MLRFGRIGENVIPDVSVVHDIVAKAELLIDHRGERFDAVGIDLGELLDQPRMLLSSGASRSISSSLMAIRASRAMWRTCSFVTDMMRGG